MKKEILITDYELIKEAERLLIKSGNAAKSRTKTRTDYINKGIKYELETGRKLVEQIKRELPDKWNEWVKLTHAYLCSDREYGIRPTIDRRSSIGHYCLDNIDFLTSYLHTLKDRAVGVTVYDFHKKSFNQYATMREASEALFTSVETVSTHCGSGVLHKDRYLIQSEGKRVGKSNNKKKRNQMMPMVLNVLVDDDGEVVMTSPAQIKGEISFPMIEARRQESSEARIY